MDIVDQYYWLAYAKKAIDDTAGRLTDAAGKISSLVAVFWGIYTAAFTAGIAVKKLDEPPLILMLLILPIPLLIFSYMSALWAQMPDLSLDGLDPRAPADVMNYYSLSTRNRKRRVMTALVLFFISGISLSIALVFGNFTHDRSDKKELVSIRPGDKNVMLSGDLPNGTVAAYQVTTVKGIILNDSTVVTSDSHFDKTLPQPLTDYKVTVSWIDPGDKLSTHIFSKMVKASSPGKKGK